MVLWVLKLSRWCYVVKFVIVLGIGGGYLDFLDEELRMWSGDGVDVIWMIVGKF